MIEKAEADCKELVRKRDICARDKDEILRTISELDEKKNATLVSAWGKINKDFGSIFKTLLPGTDAELAPSDGKDILNGVEVRVAFGGKWKESLVELSGGQRSLLALSLILAMLLYKPAPMYILDEVDAALDLSHTQNIGRLLRTHFKTSQFIVVSLKEGMFDNANVVFTTQNVDGVSSVNRTELRIEDAPLAEAAGEEEGAENMHASRKPVRKRMRGRRSSRAGSAPLSAK